MTRVSASAPGKIVLSGEYAVLYGSPAVALAIDRRAEVRVHLHGNDVSLIRTIGFDGGEIGIRVLADGSVEWPNGKGLPLVDRVCREIGGLPWPGFSMELDTAEFFDRDAGAKYGFGSSAALCCALVLAALETRGNPNAALTTAAAAHRAFQDGAGSGVDIATSFHGGLNEFRMHQGHSCTALRWPTGLRWMTFWTGRIASTRDQLRKLAGLDATARSLAFLRDAAESAAQGWRAGDAERVLTEMQSYTNALRKFDTDFQLGIFDAGHADLWRMAQQKGILYKPCGAGGGDIGVAFGLDAGNMQAFEQAVNAAGFQKLEISADSRGAAIDNGYDGD